MSKQFGNSEFDDNESLADDDRQFNYDKSAGKVKENSLSTLWTWIKSKFSSDRASFLGYKEYSALISQTGTSDPTIIEIVNTFSGTVTWTRGGVGQYVATLSVSQMTTDKTVALIGSQTGYDDVPNRLYNIFIDGVDSIVIYASDLSGTYADGAYSLYIQVRVYD